MSNQNSTRVTQSIEDYPNSFRDDSLFQILNDIEEEINGKGFLEVLRTGPFVTSITLYKTASKLAKRMEILITRSPSPFVSSIQKKIYNEAGIHCATVTKTIARNVDKSVKDITTTIVRV